MNSTGIVRRIDELGRIVIPREIRKQIGIHEGGPLEIYVDKKERTVTLKKYMPLDCYSETVNVLRDFMDDDFSHNELSNTEKQTLYDVIKKLERKIEEGD